MEIKRPDKESYIGKRFTARYRTDGYYDVREADFGFKIEYVPFETTEERSFEDEFFGEWLYAPIAYGVFENERLPGYAEGSLEKWNNRFRISNICVFDGFERRRGIGTVLIKEILAEAEREGARMAVLETQSCNENAIAFYRKNGFDIIGFDLYAYSNTDITSIGKLAFCGCTSLTSVTIGKGVTSIGKWAFNSCSKLTEMKYNGTMEEWKAIEKGDNWAYNTPFETIHCNGGDIKK